MNLSLKLNYHLELLLRWVELPDMVSGDWG